MVEKAELRQIRIHDLRHTMATLLLVSRIFASWNQRRRVAAAIWMGCGWLRRAA
jgi:integrase